jgi:hypothetical protein
MGGEMSYEDDTEWDPHFLQPSVAQRSVVGGNKEEELLGASPVS